MTLSSTSPTTRANNSVMQLSSTRESRQNRGSTLFRAVQGLVLLVPFALASALPLSADETSGDDARVEVLYHGPLVHDQNWRIKAGPRGPENQLFRAFGGTCSMVPHDVFNVTGSGIERVTFEAKRDGLAGVWKITWKDTISGRSSDGNHYKYQQRWDYVGITKNREAPEPSHAMPSPGGGSSFLDHVPSNVTADALDLEDFFLLLNSWGGVVASSHVRNTFRLQIPPVSLDPPPSFFPAILPGGYIINTYEQLAGQFGCDPL